MSMQAGIWHYDHKPISLGQVGRFEEHLSLQGPDGRGEYQEPGFAMIYRAFHITNEDILECQPIHGPYGSVLTWDGRLDNRAELRADLDRSERELSTDAEIVSAALIAWGTKAFRRLVGDWALAWWKPRERRLVLARDYIGNRKLYYLATTNGIYWSTDLAALVLQCGERYTLCDEYVAGFFTSYAEPQLTPYQEIKSVAPGGYSEVTQERIRNCRYWSFNSFGETRYRSDRDYEAHFRHLFRQAVRRRLRTAYPVLADLSGGLDSSSIVCMAYDILRSGEAQATINTISMYSLEEPGGDERPYFRAIEEYIGKVGTHLQASSKTTGSIQSPPESYFSALPGYSCHTLEEETRLMVATAGQGNRLHFSGLGGDEILGGIQNPIPNLAWDLWHLRLPSFWRQLEAWALKQKTTVWSLLFRSVQALTPLAVTAHFEGGSALQPVQWLSPDFVQRQHIARRRGRVVLNWTDWLPGPVPPDSNYLALAASLAGRLPRFTFAEQAATPYYDRDLVQFLFAIPGEQVLRANQRRSLMRRALVDIVPDVVLSRKTKWLGRREVISQIVAASSALPKAGGEVKGIVDRYVQIQVLQDDIRRLEQGEQLPLLLIQRCFSFLLFVDALVSRKALQSELKSDRPVVPGHSLSIERKEC